MYDVTKPSSFSNLKAWVEELREHASPHIVVMLIGNKTDLDTLRLVPAEAAETFAGVFPFPPPPFSPLVRQMNTKQRG
jgi:GTPase SAR1 family protein